MLEAEDYYLRTMVAAVESIRSGVTTVQDDYVHMPGTPDAQDAAAQAYLDSGLRAWMTVDLWDIGLLDCLPYLRSIIPAPIQREIESLPPTSAREQLALFQRHYEKWSGREGMRIVIAPCRPPLQRRMLREIGASPKRSISIQPTLETKLQAVQARDQWGMTAVEYFGKLGLLVLPHHRSWRVAHRSRHRAVGQAWLLGHYNPLCNMKLGSGLRRCAGCST